LLDPSKIGRTDQNVNFHQGKKMKPFIASAAMFAFLLGVGATPASAEETPIVVSERSSSLATVSRTAKISLDNLDPQRVRRIAYDITQKKFNNSKPRSEKAKHFMTPKVSREGVSIARNKIRIMAGFYADVAEVEDFTFFWANKSEGKALKKLLCDKANYCEDLKLEDYCGVGLHVDLYVHCHPGNNDKYLFTMFVMHNYTHAVQNQVSLEHMPNWFSEGAADYFGGHFSQRHYSTGFAQFGNYYQDSIASLYEDQKIVKFKKIPTRKNVIDALVATEERFPEDGYEQAQLGYYLGAIAVEALVASFGLEKFNQFWRSTKGKDFYVAFEDAYGLSTRSFYKKLAPYAVEMIKRDR
jgi:hypothetical protein